MTTTPPPPAKKMKVADTHFCQVCDLALNSQQQASQHYNGKNHLKKLKKLNLPITPENTPGFSSTTITQNELSVSSTSQGTNSTDQPPPPVTTNHTAQGNNNDPVSKAVMENMLGKLPTKRRVDVRCEVCSMTFTSQVHADSHFQGVKHAKKLLQVKNRGGDIFNACIGGVSTTAADEALQKALSKTTEIKEMKHAHQKVLYCTFCDLHLNSPQQMEMHRQGLQHKKNVEKKRQETHKLYAPPPKSITCDECLEIFATQEEKDQHIQTPEHKEEMIKKLQEDLAKAESKTAESSTVKSEAKT